MTVIWSGSPVEEGTISKYLERVDLIMLTTEVCDVGLDPFQRCELI